MILPQHKSSTEVRHENLNINLVHEEVIESSLADHRLKKLLIIGQILHVGILGNVYRTVWRICILMLGCKGFSYIVSGQNPLIKFTATSSSCLELVTLFITPIHTGLSCCLRMQLLWFQAQLLEGQLVLTQG